MESNIERMLLYTMSNYLETHTRNILPLLTSMKQLFSIHEVLWIERHEVLEELYILRHSSESPTPINTKTETFLKNQDAHFSFRYKNKTQSMDISS